MSEETQAEPLPPGDQEINLAPATERVKAEREQDAVPWSEPISSHGSTSRLAMWSPGMDEVREIPDLPKPAEAETGAQEPAVEQAPPLAAYDRRMSLMASARVPQLLVSQRREQCRHCGGTGHMPNVSDYLRESMQLIGDQGDEVVRAFYVALFRSAPELVKLFPGNPTEGDLGTDHRGARQRELLLSALVSLADLYDPEDADKMERLDTALGSFGRKHAAFGRGNGTIRGATWEEYGAVKDALFQTLIRAAGEKWKPEYAEAWSQAYDYAAAVMVAEQYRSGFSAPRFPRV